MGRKKISYRKHNYLASEERESLTITIHPDLRHGLNKIAKGERKSIAWLVEVALADYFGVEVMLRQCKKIKKAYGEE